MNNNIQQAYEQVRKFNQIAGFLQGGPVVDQIEGINNQLGFVREEVKEMIDGFNLGDAEELLDGACDAFVTVAGVMQRLEVAGFNVEKALHRVCENNLRKYPLESEHNKSDGKLAPEGAAVVLTPYGYVVYKVNGKVAKPTNFVPVNLEGCYPENFFDVTPEPKPGQGKTKKNGSK